MDPVLVKHLNQLTTVITPSRRMSARIRQDSNAIFAEKQRCWSTPRVYALNDWLVSCWEQLEIDGTIAQQLLSSTQSLLRWEYIIQQESMNKPLLRTYEAAKSAFEAWDHHHQWLCQTILNEPSDNIDHATFRQWAKTYHEWLSANHYIDVVQLPEKLLEMFIVEPRFKQKLVLYGFEEFSPLLARFFQTLNQHSWEIESLAPIAIASKPTRAFFAQPDQEFICAAAWAKDLLAKGKRNIAVVVPDLAKHRNRIEILFKDLHEPLGICQPAAEVSQKFNISAALPLIQYPLIHDALTMLKFSLSPGKLSAYLTLLQSPFFGKSETESMDRVRHGQDLKLVPLASWSLATALDFLTKLPSANLKEWQRMLQALASYVKTFQNRHRFSEWAIHFKNMLQILGWPGERVLNSIEYQIVKRWHELLHEMSLCDSILEAANFSQALNTLQKIAANIPFQPQDKGAPVQILGLLEAVGQHFDHLWVTGLNHEAWPPPARPNPFIPIELQRKLKMPHASSEREMIFAQKVTDRLKESAPEIIFSYAIQENERVLGPSNLIREIPLNTEYSNTYLNALSPLDSLLITQTVLEEVFDSKAPSITNEESFTGTSRTLTLQSLCPFKAFAEIRLKAKPLLESTIWLEPYQQGILIHQILEKYWSTALSHTEFNLEEMIETLIDQQLKIMIKGSPASYIEVEKWRLKTILLDIIEKEKERPPFKVFANEVEKSLDLAGLNFRFRFDRIDLDQENRYFLIDYKTGKVSIADLFGARPKAPQMPLYFLAAEDLSFQAFIVAKLSSQGCEFEGLSSVDIGIPGVKTLTQWRNNDSGLPETWEDLSHYWRQQLEPLAESFKEGKASVDPLEGMQTCQHCQLRCLCRIAERNSA